MRSTSVVKEELAYLYGARCMLTERINNITYHHCIIKKCNGGKETVYNGALLNRQAHDFLNKIEIANPELYDEINEAIELYKLCVEQGQTECIHEYREVQRQFTMRMEQR